MSNALRDSQKVSSVLAADEKMKKTVALKANDNGALKISGGKKLKEVIKLDLGKSRNKVLFDKSFNEITISVIEGEFTLFINEAVQIKGLTINRALSIETTANKFYISNGSGKGQAEIWIWE